MRVVLDSNIIVSALLEGRGKPARVLDAWRRSRFVLVTSEEQLEELRRVTRYARLRSLIKPAAAGVIIKTLRTQAQVLAALPAVDRSPDPGDNFLLAMAEAGKAEYLVTGDKHDPLSLERHARTQIVSVHSFLTILGKSSRGTRRKNPSREAGAGKRARPSEFTRAEQRRIRAHIRARGTKFEVFLPESLANWLRKKIRAGAFEDPAEAAFLAFQDLMELDRHPHVRRQLLNATLQAAIDDPRPRIPAEKVLARLRARARRYARTKPPRPKPLPRRRRPG